jgi:hypothetical protein
MNYEQGELLLKLLEVGKDLHFESIVYLIEKTAPKSIINSGMPIKTKENSMHLLDLHFVYEIKLENKTVFFKTKWLDKLTEEQITEKRKKKERLTERFVMVLLEEDKKRLWNFFSTALKKEFHFLKTRF